ncbi:hypothetical protein PMAYCL1PPCAC_11211 [Pristionchus mayeri]|uniref:Uncharacterized protein n=1 Tax=Pristionchus mayeri TaxID=1317129 RepID=A0AAN5CG67_9BILA|nr:hypothetical protein PMAYCL1PPCAC_11211 [Pristionchus mayeri]
MGVAHRSSPSPRRPAHHPHAQRRRDGQTRRQGASNEHARQAMGGTSSGRLETRGATQDEHLHQGTHGHVRDHRRKGPSLRSRGRSSSSVRSGRLPRRHHCRLPAVVDEKGRGHREGGNGGIFLRARGRAQSLCGYRQRNDGERRHHSRFAAHEER